MSKDKYAKRQTHVKSAKVDAKLRMFANCSQSVNEIRSEFRGDLIIKKSVKPKMDLARDQNLTRIPEVTHALKKKKSAEASNNILTNVFVELSNPSLKVKGEILRKGNLVSAQVSLTELSDLSSMEGIIKIESSRTLRLPEYKVTNQYAQPNGSNGLLKSYRTKAKKQNDVLIGIVDVGGFDFSHPEFLLKNGETKFISIWDQGSDFRKSPKQFDYGAEFTREHLNAAIKNSKKIGIPAYLIEKQSQISVGSHGTHVASIAAGNSGVCPDAQIVGVLITLKPEDLDRRKSFYDSTCLIHAVEYLLSVAKELKKPIAINISLGTNGHAHDGSDAVGRWIDSELTLPGRCITVAAGNAGQEAPLTDNDFGYTMGRIHTSGKIEATGLSEDIHWNVVGNGISDVSENELEIWYEPQDRISVMLKPPGLDWIGPVLPNEFVENMQLKDGSYISIYNDLYHAANGLNYISIYLSPNFNVNGIIPIKAGTWQVRLGGKEIRTGEYHAWIERDDPRPLGAVGETKDVWNFPSFFTQKSNVDNTSVSSLACARHVISVGNFDHEREIVNETSSQGPTRDKRLKPEIIAPGSNITAAKGFAGEKDRWISMTGTSMSAPLVCGIAANMLSMDKSLTAAQILSIMVRTSKPLPSMNYAWKNDCGFGVINPEGCMKETKVIHLKRELKP